MRAEHQPLISNAKTGKGTPKEQTCFTYSTLRFTINQYNININNTHYQAGKKRLYILCNI